MSEWKTLGIGAVLAGMLEGIANPIVINGDFEKPAPMMMLHYRKPRRVAPQPQKPSGKDRAEIKRRRQQRNKP